VILGILFITMFLIEETELKKLRNTIARQELEMEEKQNVINSYAQGYIKQCKCDCAWYEDFYYEHSEEVGAYE
jgi:hypothetical protein